MPDPATPPPIVESGLSAETSSGLPAPLAAGLATIFLVVGGVVFLVVERKSAFVRFYAMQAVIFGLVAMLLGIVLKLAYLMFFFIPVLGHLIVILLGLGEVLFWIAWFIVYLVAIVKAFSGKEWEIPWVGPIARRQLAKVVA